MCKSKILLKKPNTIIRFKNTGKLDIFNQLFRQLAPIFYRRLVQLRIVSRVILGFKTKTLLLERPADIDLMIYPLTF